MSKKMWTGEVEILDIYFTVQYEYIHSRDENKERRQHFFAVVGFCTQPLPASIGKSLPEIVKEGSLFCCEGGGDAARSDDEKAYFLLRTPRTPNDAISFSLTFKILLILFYFVRKLLAIWPMFSKQHFPCCHSFKFLLLNYAARFREGQSSLHSTKQSNRGTLAYLFRYCDLKENSPRLAGCGALSIRSILPPRFPKGFHTTVKKNHTLAQI
jgi:hypothetical protein